MLQIMSVVVMVAMVVEEDKRKRTFFLGSPEGVCSSLICMSHMG